jgi:predicted transcriptional regulator
MMSSSQFDKLMEKLDTLIRLSALSAVQGKSIAESVLALADIGFGNAEIARILGITPNYVSKIKYENKKGKTVKPTKEIEFHAEDLLNVLNNATMFPSTRELRDFAEEILNIPFSIAIYESRGEMINEIIRAFQNSDRRKQALFIQALEHRAAARELKDTQFLRFFEGWESHIKG